MAAFAHVAGLPVEETALSLLPTGGMLWLAARTALRRFAHRNDQGEDR